MTTPSALSGSTPDNDPKRPSRTEPCHSGCRPSEGNYCGGACLDDLPDDLEPIRWPSQNGPHGLCQCSDCVEQNPPSGTSDE